MRNKNLSQSNCLERPKKLKTLDLLGDTATLGGVSITKIMLMKLDTGSRDLKILVFLFTGKTGLTLSRFQMTPCHITGSGSLFHEVDSHLLKSTLCVKMAKLISFCCLKTAPKIIIF